VVARQAELHCGLDARREARKKFNNEAHKAHEEERKTAPSGDKMVTLLYGQFYCVICAVSVFFFVRFVRFVVKTLAFLLLEIHYQIELL